MIYDNDDHKGVTGTTRHIGKKLSLDNFEVHNCFSPTAKTQELKPVLEPKLRRKSDSYNDWHKSLQERSRYATAYSRPANIHEMPELVSFVVEPKHHLNKDVNVVLSEVHDCALEKYTFSSDSESTDSTQETLQRLCFITNDYKLDSDSESCDSTKETLERLTCIANELKFGMESDDEEEDFDVSIQDQRSSNNENPPVEKIIHTVHSTKQIREKELASREKEAEQIQYNQGSWTIREASSSSEDDCENETTLSSISEIQGNIPNPRGSVSVVVPRQRQGSQGSIQSSASGASFAFPLLEGELTKTPQVMPSPPRQGQIVAAERKTIHWYPRWRVLSCCRAV
ncbi:hypothetical protein M5689_017032 [Euphorbia peplus]|nr:hypothetical protein M5689_017032 [Euphorbia peplus]